MEMVDVNHQTFATILSSERTCHQTFATMSFQQWKNMIDPVKDGICAVRHGDSPVNNCELTSEEIGWTYKPLYMHTYYLYTYVSIVLSI